MATVYNRTLTSCPFEEECIERQIWSPEVAKANCPDNVASRKYGAKLCPASIKRANGRLDDVPEYYSESFNLSLANFISWSCSSRCVYDIVYQGVVYQWRSGEKNCWEMQTKWHCIATEREQYAWALDYVANQLCDEPTFIPSLSPSALPTEMPTGTPTKLPTEMPTGSPTELSTICYHEWTQKRSDETCPDLVHHDFGVKLCSKYLNPDYTRRLQFGLANNLYLDCSHKCVYDYRSINDSVHLAFRWTGKCYNVNIGKWYCIDNEKDAMATVYNRTLTSCPFEEECIERQIWSPEVAKANCPDHVASRKYGAKLCPAGARRANGRFDNVQEYYSESFKLSLANFISWSCSSICLYDIVYQGVVYQWRSQWRGEEKNCWEMQTEWHCIGTESEQYAWALDYVANQLCYEPTPTPETFITLERVTEWNEKIALESCLYDTMGWTNKGSGARVCKGKEDYQYRLDRSLANRMFMSCDAWCVYDIFSNAREAFIWKNATDLKCWLPVTEGSCFKAKDHKLMIDYVENILGESDTPEPTYQPTCIPQREWSEELMDEYCTVAATVDTYKHYESLNRRPVPCKGLEDREADLLKSLAMQMYDSCSAWCVYDFYSNAIEAWLWKNELKCWQLHKKNSCIWNWGKNEKNPDWDDAKEKMNLMCTYSPTIAPTDCMPYYSWNKERAEELCPKPMNADKSYGVFVCNDANSAKRQEQLEKSLANKFYQKCESSCVYDYDTLIYNVQQDELKEGGFIWKANCWKWVTGWDCFSKHRAEFVSSMHIAAETCDAKKFGQ